MKNVVSLKHDMLSDLLDECRLKQNLSIRCRDEKFVCNSFLFASIFPGLGRIVDSPNIQEEDLVIFIPDICVRDLRSVFNGIYNKQNITLKQNLNLQFLLNWERETAKDPSEKIKDDLQETIKRENNDGSDEIEPNVELFEPISDINETVQEEKPVLISLKKKRKIRKPIDYKYEDNTDLLEEVSLQHHVKWAHEGIRRNNRMSPKMIAAQCDKECNCGIDFKMVKEKVAHYKIVHLGYEECPKCKKLVKSLGDKFHICEPIKRQKQNKVESVVCEDCGKEIHGGRVTYHMKKYHEIVECSCDKCGKKFSNTMSLKDHTRECMKTEQCNLCGAVVRRISYHMKNVHTAEKDKPFVCNICGKGFFQKGKLENHKMNNHLKLRPHRCRYGCDIGYNDTSNRNAHEKKKHGGLFDEAKMSS